MTVYYLASKLLLLHDRRYGLYGIIFHHTHLRLNAYSQCHLSECTRWLKAFFSLAPFGVFPGGVVRVGMAYVRISTAPVNNKKQLFSLFFTFLKKWRISAGHQTLTCAFAYQNRA